MRIHMEGAPVGLPAGVEAAVLRIAQGALANTREHAAATSVTITLTDLGDRLVLDIADDGQGFDPAETAGAADRGHGLPAMRARLRQLGHPHRRNGARRRHGRLRRSPPGAVVTEAETPVRLVICDDHVVVRARLRALLGSTPGIDVVGEAGSGPEVVALAERLQPDVVLMDLQLGGDMDGIEATRRITAGGGATPHVQVLTTYDTDADITRAIAAGATGYLLEAERPEELFAAIHAAAQGRTALSPPIADRVLNRMRNPQPALTARELDILGQLSRGLGNREIARARPRRSDCGAYVTRRTRPMPSIEPRRRFHGMISPY
ncbi:response regulator [Nocardia sp. NPDC101769]|uniref:response regulator n=1 Tax=Nocardia sp. NPDC101769 TaxID=3364333 RepID=UPI00382F2F89